MISVGKKEGPAKCLVTRNLRNWLGRAAGRAHLVDWSSICGNEKDNSFVIPCRAKNRRRLTYDLDSAAARIDGFKSAFSEEPDLAAIRRPERVHCSLSAG